MVMSSSKYEETRLQRIEENKKRMEELKLCSLVLNFKTSSSSSKPSQAKPPKRRMIQKKLEFVEVRRSSRNTDKPSPVYKEVPVFEYERAPRNNSRARGLRDSMENFPVASEKERAIATEKAYELELSLGNEFPSFVKPMLHSHVNRGFWLGLPNGFCKKYLPKRDALITLVDEKGDECVTNYLVEKTGLSAGWRGFALDHQLIDGDACVFQLTKPTEFKVYIVRAANVSYPEESVGVSNGEESS
ncbi:hypothetical protein C5167_017793 [Papaver somniferum]|uniref:TF-B3 domain-containing protein n=1 Tax=Papaver somniferum TaxID=3469 RepID=A0A4Y7INI3_PAPSO|nr:B3 domain-containing protein At3g19184-like [Papaver somniferum]XP_026452680.1 B3 domain-containing protein At3g19184-like [Papaver somniferum]RZC49370.1 hypothetical protein C5167_017793 [Papaver somniferum]